MTSDRAFGHIRRHMAKAPCPAAAADTPSIAALIRRIDEALADRRGPAH